VNKRLLILTVFTPFVCGYYVSYIFRTIVAVIATRLSSDLGLNAADIGILTSVYFLVFALAQLPLGFMLDRHGPRRVQTTLLLIAASGATLFGLGDSFEVLLLSRAMIGLGVSGALMAGLKAIALWFPTDKLPLVNGWFVMLGGLGAVTATEPTEILLNWIGWRDFFKLLGIITALCAFAIYLVVPEYPTDSATARSSKWVTLRGIYVDPRFWRLAPLSASCIGAAWAWQGLWASAWLADVEKVSRAEIVQYLLVMALALSAGALVLGAGANFLSKYGIRPRVLFIGTMIVFILVQLCLVAGISLPQYLIWSVVGCVAAATVLSYAVLAELFPKDCIGRANAGLNVLHVGAGFAIQCFIGIVIEHWTNIAGHYPPIAYKTAFSSVVLLQFVALVWFAFPNSRMKEYLMPYVRRLITATGQSRHGSKAVSPYEKAIEIWNERLEAAQVQTASWRWVALGSLAMASLLIFVCANITRKSSVLPYVVPVERLGTVHGAVYFKQSYRPSDALISYFIAQFIEDVRSLSMDPVVVYARWRRAYRYLTDRAARTLDDYAAKADPFSKIGIRTTAVEMSSVVRVSPNSFKVKWKEITYDRKKPLPAEQFTGTILIVFKASDVPERQRENPLGLYIHGLNWSRDLDDGAGHGSPMIRGAMIGGVGNKP
jgi:type IV secretory pathway TrbF-like protein/predicted MFS family arabinose efflux permease